MDPHQRSVIEAARRLGIDVERLDEAWGMDAIRLTHGARSELVLEGRIFGHLTAVADAIAANKLASRSLMVELGIPVPAVLAVHGDRLDPTAIGDFIDAHEVVVAKPRSGTDGLGVAMNLASVDEVIDHVRTFPTEDGRWLVEEQVAGDDLRLQWLDGTLVAACVRRPCFVVGDGERSIVALIEARNQLIHTQNPDNHVVVDHQVERRLLEVGATLDTVLDAGVELQLKDVSNMAQGGHAIDVTDAVHPGYGAYMERLASSLGLRLFSLDVMTPDPAADPDLAARVLELNAQPAWLHHTFSEGRQHDIPALILRNLFELG